MNYFVFDMAAKSEILNSNSILPVFIHILMLEFLEQKSKELKSTQKQTSKQLNYTDSTSKQYRDNVQMGNP